MNNDGRYVQFAPKSDGTNEVISSEHINTLQEVSERTQQGIFKSQDRDFLDKALFVLQNHRVLNAMWIDVFENTSKTNLRKSTGVVFSETEQAVTMLDDYMVGEVYSTVYQNPDGSKIKKVLVIASGYTPQDTNINLAISNNGVDWISISSGSDSIVTLPTEGTYIIMRATLSRTSIETPPPRLDAWAVLFLNDKNNVIELPDGESIVITPPTSGDGDEDDDTGFGGIINIMHDQLMGVGPDDHHPQVHAHNGIDGSGLVSHTDLTDIGEDDHHSKDHQHGQDGVGLVDLSTDIKGALPVDNLSYMLWTGKPGSTGLYFDPSIGDKLVYVKTPDDETYMFYDLVEDRLSHSITITQGIAVWEKLHFTNYVTSAGATEIVLGGTEKTHYDATDPLILNEIAAIAAPAAPKGVLAVDAGLGGVVTLTWHPSPEFDLAGYNVFMSVGSTNVWNLQNGTGLLTAPIFTKSGLTDGVTYHFKIEAIDLTGYKSDHSQVVSAKPSSLDSIPPAIVSGLSAIKVQPGEVRLEWNESTDIDFKEYSILQSAVGTPTGYSVIHTITDRTITHINITGLDALSTFYFIITATDLSNNTSPPSDVVSVIA